MLDTLTKMYSKYNTYTVHILIIFNILAYFNPDPIRYLLFTLYKLLPTAIVEYFTKSNFTFFDAFNIFAIFAVLTGFTVIWRQFYRIWFRHWFLERYPDHNMHKYKLHMDSIHNFVGGATTLIFLFYLILYQTNITSFDLIDSYFQFFWERAKFFTFLGSVGVLYTCYGCIILLLVGLNTAEIRVDKNNEEKITY